MDLLICLALTVMDGDTFKQGTEKYRMLKIDAPETKQEFGKQSRDKLASLLKGRIKKSVTKKDLYGRNLTTVTKGSKNINLIMVKEGYAWIYYTKDKEFIQAEKYARDNHLGLWSNSKPIPPWEFRKGSKIK